MKRRILISLMVIGAASMLMIGGLAQFIGSGSGSGDVTAGTVTVNVTDFDDSGCVGLGDGDTCTITADVDWSGSLDANLDISATAVSETESGCWEISNLTVEATLEAPGPVAVVGTLTAAVNYPKAVTGNSSETFAVGVDATVSGSLCAGSSAVIDITADTIEIP